ncbi:MAG: hypothetical protein IJV70_03765 [Clostridia bacterium]|nr:hypothetical protein [Clostridia bacterium]
MQNTARKEKASLYSGWTYLMSRIFYGKTYKEKLLFLAESGISAVFAAVFYSAELPFVTLALGAPLLDAFVCSVGKTAIGALRAASGRSIKRERLCLFTSPTD